MGNNLVEILGNYQIFLEQLSEENVEKFREFASTNMRYRDPLEDAKGIDATLAYMHRWFINLDDLKFQIKETAVSGRHAFFHWRMIFRIKKSPRKLWELDGISKIIFNEEGKIEDQIDYWDSSPLIESFPILGKVVSLIKKIYSG
jgi:steroid delta-isomerase